MKQQLLCVLLVWLYQYKRIAKHECIRRYIEIYNVSPRRHLTVRSSIFAAVACPGIRPLHSQLLCILEDQEPLC